ncbi:hypothetical protein QVD17_17376 [Tagetes erecta]|uniref:CCHC-type domain-containing protein n=1 Tax=Tagetes erecta TaxID=13708 RepID=A0AAD8KS55_TARER|nr:hypothetical protein QVD17_17376 [Tagetes erecta]
MAGAGGADAGGSGAGGAIMQANNRTQNNINNIPLQCPRLSTTNYTSWSIMVESILQAYGLWEAFDPVTGGTVEAVKNSMARAFVLQTLPEEVLIQVAKYKDAKDVWEALRVRYLGADRVQKARLQMLRTELAALKMKESETIDEFSGKLIGVTTKFKSLGSSLDDEIVVRKLLTSVPKKFLQIVASIEQCSEIENMSLEEAVGRLKAYEERIKVYDEEDNDQGKLLLTKEEWEERTKRGEFDKEQFGRGRGQGRGRGYGRGRGGRFQSNEDRRDQGWYRDKRNIKCYNCQEYGHYAAECPKHEQKEDMANLIRDDDEPALL